MKLLKFILIKNYLTWGLKVVKCFSINPRLKALGIFTQTKKKLP